MNIDQHTALYGVIGSPLRHSLSPIIQNAAFQERGVNAVFLAFETKDLGGAIQGVRALEIKGLSVTLPFKEAIVPYLDELDMLAGEIGAANTVANRDGMLIGYNTDAIGAIRALEGVVKLTGANALILGAGGAARAIGHGLVRVGCAVTISNRSKERGESLARDLGATFIPPEGLYKYQTDILINTTPLGMYPEVHSIPISTDMVNAHVVMDAVYNPHETRLLKEFKRLGATVVSGLEMFLQQGAEQFRLWTGLNPPLRTMRQAALRALEGFES